MKRLLVLRHGKSDWDADFRADFDRPLAPRGKKAAVKMAAFIRDNSLTPEVVVSSPAERAARTAQIVTDNLGKVEIRYEPNIYGASSSELVRIVQGLPDDTSSVLIVGHNPGLEELVEVLTDAEYCVLKTCSLAVIECESENWAGFAGASLVGPYHPREI